MRKVRTAAAVLVLGLYSARSRAEDATIPGEITAPHPTVINLAVEWKIRGDDNLNGTVTVRYRRAGGKEWHNAMPLRRVPAGKSRGTRPIFTWENKHSGSIFDLRPGTAYEINLKLADPDGGAAEKTILASTRAVPPQGRAWKGRAYHVVAGASGGDGSASRPFGSIQEAEGHARPGNVFLVHAGVYRGGFRIERSGTEDGPIFYCAAGDGEAIIADVADSGDAIVDARGARYVHLEGLTVGGVTLPARPASRNVCADFIGQAISGRRIGIRAGGSKRLVVRRCRVECVFGITAYKPGATDAYIADNVVIGTTPWTSEAMGASGKNVGEGIEITGPGNVICYNKVTGFRDSISTMEDTGTVNQVCIDIYNNDVFIGADDGIEADFCFHNCRIVRNRLTNCFVGLSSQPGLGGPTYFIRNVMYNLTHCCFKFHRHTRGDVALHNTVVKVGAGMGCYTSEPHDFAFFRNNLCIGGPDPQGKWGNYGSGTPSAASMSRHGPHTSFDYDAVGTYKIPFRARIGGRSFNAAEPHGKRINMDVFNGVAFPEKPVPGYEPPDLRPRPGSAVVDAACLLPNVNDQFRGAGPDIGAYEAGQPLPRYGPRPPGVDEGTAPAILAARKPAGSSEPGESVWSLVAQKLKAGAKEGQGGAELPALAEARKLAARGDYEGAARRLEGEEAEEQEALAAGFRGAEAMRGWIIDGAEAGRQEATFVDLMGVRMRGKVVAADEDGFTVNAIGSESKLAWGELSPRKFLSLARKYARAGGETPAEKEAALELFARACGLKEP